MVLVAIIGDADPAHQFHHKVGPARFRRPCVQHLGDVGMVHQRQGLPLRLEPGYHLPGVHAQLDDLESHPAFDRLLLLGHIDQPRSRLHRFFPGACSGQSACPDSLGAPTRRARLVGGAPTGSRNESGFSWASSSACQPGPQSRIARAGLVEEGFTLRPTGPLESLSEKDCLPLDSRVHKQRPLRLQSFMRIPGEKGADEFHEDRRISTASQARAKAHHSLAVRTAMPRTAAASSKVIPVK